MVGRMKEQLNNEKGAVTLLEATIIFPIMFIVLIFLLYMGNAFYIKTQVDEIVVDKAIKGAAYCADPMLATIEETGAVPDIKNLDVQPYRYLFGGMNDVVQSIENETRDEIEDGYVSFFKNMKPELVACEAEYNNKFLYSTFSVDVRCNIGLPIKMLGATDPFSITLNIRSEVAVNDTSELIRNVDMVIDYFCDTSFGQKVSSVFEKVNEFMTSFANN